MTSLEQTIREHIGPLKRTAKGWETRNCMMCTSRGETPDTRGRFGIKFSDESIGIHCFNCKFETGHTNGHLFGKEFIKFLRAIGVPEHDIKVLNFASYKNNESLIKKYGLVNISETIKQWKEVDFPENTKTLSEWAILGETDKNFIKVVEYAINRKLYNFDDLYWCPSSKGMINRRLLIPFFYRKKLVGYSGRYFSEKTPNKNIPKYKNSSPLDFVFNLDNQYKADRKFVILVEGIIDAIHVDGISIVGNEINDVQASLVNSLGKKVIVCPDKDKAGDLLVTEAVNRGWAVSFPKWGDNIKDVGRSVELNGKLFTIQTILENVVDNPVKIQLYRKLKK